MVKRTGREDERGAALTLSEILGGLPLAHEQAAAYCERLGVSLSDYCKRFEAAPARLLDNERDAPADYRDRLTVMKTFALAIEEATKLHSAAELLIVHAALLPPEPIPLYIFVDGREMLCTPLASALEGDGVDEVVLALRTFGLVDRVSIAGETNSEVSSDCIRLHRLVRQVAALRIAEQRNDVLSALVNALAEAAFKASLDLNSGLERAKRIILLKYELAHLEMRPINSEYDFAYRKRSELHFANQEAAALDALGRTEEAAALREKYGLQATRH